MSFSNPWLNSAKNKKIFSAIEDLAMEVWGEDGTFGDLLSVLSDEETDFLFNMKITDFAADIDDLSIGFELKQ